MVEIVTGIQWGDEGKGKVTHCVSNDSTVVIRATGGNNAGHTVVDNNGRTFKLHLLPSSIVRSSTLSIIGNGVVLDLSSLIDELNELRNNGIIITPKNFRISNKAHIVMPWHKDLDKIYEHLRSNPIGTTNRGIGPCYSDKTQRVGIRLCDLFLEEDELKQKILEAWNIHKLIINSKKKLLNSSYYYIDVFNNIELNVHELLRQLAIYRDILNDYICDISPIISHSLKNNEKIVIEGAQATFLDIDHGTYPNVTSSNCISSGALTGCGIGPKYVDEIIGVMKAYTSRVGEGPFPTEQINQDGEKIRSLGHEYGTTTGRPRRCGWLDLVMIKQSIITNGITKLCINHLDTIGLFEEFKVCIAYYYHDTIIDYVPVDLENCIPEYITFKGGWTKDGVIDSKNISLMSFLAYIKSFLNVPIKYLGTGPKECDFKQI